MKKLILMRHAKADKSDFAQKDLERPLIKKGEKDAVKMAKKLYSMNIRPDLIVVSPAKRAEQTANLFAQEIGYDKEIRVLDNLYFGDENDILDIISEVENEVQTLMVVSHNPIIENLTTNLVEENDYYEYKTATICVLASYIKKWSNVNTQNFEVEHYLLPKNIEIS